MSASSPAVIVHGGAGGYKGDDLAPHRAGCRAAALHAWAILRAGGSALDAVEAAVLVLEDDPLFNAGIGAVLNNEGHVELDASIMDGVTRRAGAVGAVPRLQNPITLARRVMDDGRHVLLAGEGALAFARTLGFAECAEELLIVERQRRRWRERHGSVEQEPGTVGAVAVDVYGRLAAATSTGGLRDKLPGRIGDSAIIGAGTYADDIAAVSCTGVGEAIVRTVLAKAAADWRRAGDDLQIAAERAIAFLHDKTGADGGLIIVDSAGKTAYARNTAHMPVAYIRADGEVRTES